MISEGQSKEGRQWGYEKGEALGVAHQINECWKRKRREENKLIIYYGRYKSNPGTQYKILIYTLTAQLVGNFLMIKGISRPFNERCYMYKKN
jgi:hypothetical protein